MKYILLLLRFTEHVCTVCSFHPFNTFYCFYGIYIIVCDSKGTKRLYIHQFFLIKITISRNAHGRFGGTNSGEKSNPQRNNKKNRQKSAQTLSDFHIKIFSCCFCTHVSPLIYYHSIVSTGTGDGFSTIFDTRPFLILITRSAIGAIAELCVIKTTVMPRLRHVS